MALKSNNRFSPEAAGSDFKKVRMRAILYGGVVSFLILFLLPFTQLLSGLGRPDKQVRSFDVVQPPPPPPPEIEDPPEETPPEPPPPELTPPPPPMNLAQLELALNPGIADALAGAGGFAGFDLAPDAAMEVQLFDVQDLDELPQPVRQVRMEPPTRFRQERISGMVRAEVMIDEQGNTTVMRILEATAAELDAPARAALSQWRWTPPKKNGEPVRARYILPIGFRF